MKKLLFVGYLVIAGISTSAHPLRGINEKIVQNFKETYPNAIQVSWVEYPETYAVYFVEGGIKVNIIFSKDGSFVSSVRYYKEDYLPYYLLAEIKDKYPLKKIYSIEELSSTRTISYFVKLEDAKTWITIKLDSEGNISLVEKFNKAS
jgi:hypothetical protein